MVEVFAQKGHPEVGLARAWAHEGDECGRRYVAVLGVDPSAHGSRTPHMEREATITCPICGATKLERMLTDACLFFYECSACGSLLRPREGECCVFCSYGSTPCPPKQLEGRAPAAPRD